jgi:hypothetical protein
MNMDGNKLPPPAALRCRQCQMPVRTPQLRQPAVATSMPWPHWRAGAAGSDLGSGTHCAVSRYEESVPERFGMIVAW